MAKLDYAYLADFAAIQEGKLTAVGASFTFVQTLGFPSSLDLAIAGRVRASIDETPVDLTITIIPPGGDYEVKMAGALAADHAPRPYGDEGNIGLLFAVNAQVPVETVGLYEVFIDVQGERARRLAFEVELVTPQ